MIAEKWQRCHEGAEKRTETVRTEIRVWVCQVNISTDVDLGTIYSVALPIKRVKPVARVPMEDDVEVDGITLRWDSSDPDSDPSSEFPYGC